MLARKVLADFLELVHVAISLVGKSLTADGALVGADRLVSSKVRHDVVQFAEAFVTR